MDFCLHPNFVLELVYEKAKAKKNSAPVKPKISLLSNAPLLVDCIRGMLKAKCIMFGIHFILFFYTDAVDLAGKKHGVSWKQPFSTQFSIKIATAPGIRLVESSGKITTIQPFYASKFFGYCQCFSCENFSFPYHLFSCRLVQICPRYFYSLQLSQGVFKRLKLIQIIKTLNQIDFAIAKFSF